jgi:hypothetical protein
MTAREFPVIPLPCPKVSGSSTCLQVDIQLLGPSASTHVSVILLSDPSIRRSLLGSRVLDNSRLLGSSSVRLKTYNSLRLSKHSSAASQSLHAYDSSRIPSNSSALPQSARLLDLPPSIRSVLLGSTKTCDLLRCPPRVGLIPWPRGAPKLLTPIDSSGVPRPHPRRTTVCDQSSLSRIPKPTRV